MDLTRKPSQQLAVSGAVSLPEDLPKLPEDIRLRFPQAVADYNREMAQWWLQVRTALQRQQDDMAAELTKKLSELAG